MKLLMKNLQNFLINYILNFHSITGFGRLLYITRIILHTTTNDS